jgi:hypothetical protein
VPLQLIGAMAMNRRLGPWATGLDSIPREQLSAFWRQRLALLPSVAAGARRYSRLLGALVLLLTVTTVMAPRVDIGAGPVNVGPVDSSDAHDNQIASPVGQQLAENGAPTAVELMQKIYDDEAWPSRVDGFLLRTETVQERTEEGRKPRKIPGPFGQKPSDKPLEKSLSINRQIAWDQARVTTVSELVGYSTDRRTFSQGMAIESHTRWENGQVASQSFVLDNKADLFFEHAFDHNMQWGQLSRHMGPVTWFRKLLSRKQGGQGWDEPAVVTPPEGLRLVGREQYNGHECYRVDWPKGNDRFYIRAHDHRLVGDLRYGYRASPAEDLAIKQRIAGKPLSTVNDWTAWLESLEIEPRLAAEGKYEAERQSRLLLYAERTYDDYRQLAPGCWFPFMQRYRSYETESGKSILAVEGNMRVVEAVVNPALADELFVHMIPEGADISGDWRYDPPIRYVYSADKPEEEREKLAAKGRADREESKKIFAELDAAVDERLGQSPPKLPAEGWINSPPLSWQDLRGKAVEIVFWDIGCGPCHYTLDLIQQASADAKLRGQAFIAVHRHTKDRAAVEKALAEHEWTMPVLIDADGKNADGPSLYDWMHVKGMPWVVLVNRDGEIVAHGVGNFGSDIFAKFGELWRTGKITPPDAKPE